MLLGQSHWSKLLQIWERIKHIDFEGDPSTIFHPNSTSLFKERFNYSTFGKALLEWSMELEHVLFCLYFKILKLQKTTRKSDPSGIKCLIWCLNDMLSTPVCANRLPHTNISTFHMILNLYYHSNKLWLLFLWWFLYEFSWYGFDPR